MFLPVQMSLLEKVQPGILHFGIFVPITLNQDLEINGVFHLDNH
jgi:hypothetical protein